MEITFQVSNSQYNNQGFQIVDKFIFLKNEPLN